MSNCTHAATRRARMSALSAARGVTQVMNRCEAAKQSGYLDLSECALMYVADAIYLVLKDAEIDRCSLRGNKLKKFPKKMISKFPQMMVLNAEGNQLDEMPEEIGEWRRLKGINLARNNFDRFPAGLFAAKRLQLLDLSHNEIQAIDIREISAELPHLKQLNLAGNPIDGASQAEVLAIAETLANKIVVKFD